MAIPDREWDIAVAALVGEEVIAAKWEPAGWGVDLAGYGRITLYLDMGGAIVVTGVDLRMELDIEARPEDGGL